MGYPTWSIAAKIQPTFGQASNIALLALAVLGLVLNFQTMIDLVGSLGILVGIILSCSRSWSATCWAWPAALTVASG